MAKKGIRLSPLTWDRLREQVCQLEGYYSISMSRELWKLFSISRLLANVLPSQKGDALFRLAARRAPGVTRQARTLDAYSAIAGRPNGPSVGMTEQEWREAGIRLTGSALGSQATSVLAFFTTGWREALQMSIIDQEYPEKPFRLLSHETILAALYSSVKTGSGSQTELGMLSIWGNFFGGAERVPSQREYGEASTSYKVASGMAWLALNAETNIRQNEKLAGYEKTSLPLEPVTTLVTGSANQYRDVAQQISAARRAFGALGSVEIPSCLEGSENLVRAAATAVGKVGRIARVDTQVTEFLRFIDFEPVAADIGMEVNDVLGDRPEGLFRLALATGQGHVLETTIDGATYRLWSPSAMVLHRDQVVTTASWKRGELDAWDPWQ